MNVWAASHPFGRSDIPAGCRAAGKPDAALEYLKEGGLPLGAFSLSRYESGRTELRSGDALCIYTDGVIEAMDESGSEYGEDRLANRLPRLGLPVRWPA